MVVVKKKNALSCLLAGLGLTGFASVGVWQLAGLGCHAFVGIVLFLAAGVSGGYCLRFYVTTLQKRCKIDIVDKRLMIDTQSFRIDDNITFKLRYDDSIVWVNLFIGKRLVIKRLVVDASEFEALLRLLKPYLKYPVTAERINFHRLALFKKGFFIGKKRFLCEAIETLQIVSSFNRYKVPIYRFIIVTKNQQTYEKTIVRKKGDMQRVKSLAALCRNRNVNVDIKEA